MLSAEVTFFMFFTAISELQPLSNVTARGLRLYTVLAIYIRYELSVPPLTPIIQSYVLFFPFDLISLKRILHENKKLYDIFNDDEIFKEINFLNVCQTDTKQWHMLTKKDLDKKKNYLNYEF